MMHPRIEARRNEVYAMHVAQHGKRRATAMEREGLLPQEAKAKPRRNACITNEPDVYADAMKTAKARIDADAKLRDAKAREDAANES